MSIEDDIIVKRVTKPEGPAQEPQRAVSRSDEDLDINCAGCRAYLGGGDGPAPHTCERFKASQSGGAEPNRDFDNANEVALVAVTAIERESGIDLSDVMLHDAAMVIEEYAEQRVKKALAATPAPSQPAGAREKNWLVEAVENCPDPVLKQNCKQLLGNDYTNAAVQFIADAQTAAKDAAYEQLSDAYTKQVEHTNFIRAEYQERLRAAERERGSLREQVRTAEEAFDRMATCEDDESEEFVTAWDALGAALKAGKE